MDIVLNLISGISWSLVYIVAIFQGKKNKTWCIPKLAICQNFAWEFWIVFYRLSTGQSFSILYAVQLAWLLLDIGVMMTWLVFDKPERNPWLKKAVLLLMVMSAMYILTHRLQAWEFAAFLINTIMSVAFAYRIKKDAALLWTSRSIAVLKLVGTLAPTIVYGVIIWNPVILWLGGLCFLFDVYYLTILYEKRLKKGVGGVE